MLQLIASQAKKLHIEEIFANDLEKNNLNCLKFLGLSSEPFQFKKLFKNASTILFLCPSLKNTHNKFQKQMDYQHTEVFCFKTWMIICMSLPQGIWQELFHP